MRTYNEQTALILEKVSRYNNAKKKRLKYVYSLSAVAAVFVLISILALPVLIYMPSEMSQVSVVTEPIIEPAPPVYQPAPQSPTAPPVYQPAPQSPMLDESIEESAPRFIPESSSSVYYYSSSNDISEGISMWWAVPINILLLIITVICVLFSKKFKQKQPKSTKQK